MKKCNFFSMLFVAFFMFMGFAANAQYKPLPTSMELVSTSVSQATTHTTVHAQSNVNAQQSQLNGMKVFIGNALLKEMKAGKSVAESLDYVANQSIQPNRASVKAQVISFYKNLLTI